jgi:hypothetical protein
MYHHKTRWIDKYHDEDLNSVIQLSVLNVGMSPRTIILTSVASYVTKNSYSDMQSSQSQM